MDIAFVIKNINILENLRKFTLNGNIFAKDEVLLREISFIEKSLDNALIFLAFSLQNKIEGNYFNDESINKILDQLTKSLLKAQQIKEFSLLINDFKDVIAFIRRYQEQEIVNFSKEGCLSDLKNLQDIVLLIIANKFG